MTTTPKTSTPKILLDGRSYEIDLISDEAKALCGELQMNDSLIAHHSASLSQFRVAGGALKNELVRLLADVPYEEVEPPSE